jgi:hypothetical protein
MAVILMNFIESLRPMDFWDRMMNVGWELCILGVGVTGGIFSHPAMGKIYGTFALYVAIAVIFLDLMLGVGVLKTKQGKIPPKHAGIGCVIMGVLAVAVPSGLTFVR